MLYLQIILPQDKGNMNFLSHYYFHNDQDNNYFTVGLTLPDLLGFHSKRIRVNKKFLVEKMSKTSCMKTRALAAGMIVHLELDRWFHNSSYFKNQIFFLQNKYSAISSDKDILPGFYAHIIMEILIDRYLLKIQPDIADKFYESYKKFDFSLAAEIFADLKNFDREKFLSLSRDVAHSSFLREYVNDHAIINILKRVSRRINVPFELEINDSLFAKFIRSVFSELEHSIHDFIENAKKLLVIRDYMILDAENCFMNLTV